MKRSIIRTVYLLLFCGIMACGGGSSGSGAERTETLFPHRDAPEILNAAPGEVLSEEELAERRSEVAFDPADHPDVEPPYELIANVTFDEANYRTLSVNDLLTGSKKYLKHAQAVPSSRTIMTISNGTATSPTVLCYMGCTHMPACGGIIVRRSGNNSFCHLQGPNQTSDTFTHDENANSYILPTRTVSEVTKKREYYVTVQLGPPYGTYTENTWATHEPIKLRVLYDDLTATDWIEIADKPYWDHNQLNPNEQTWNLPRIEIADKKVQGAILWVTGNDKRWPLGLFALYNAELYQQSGYAIKKQLPGKGLYMTSDCGHSPLKNCASMAVFLAGGTLGVSLRQLDEYQKQYLW